MQFSHIITIIYIDRMILIHIPCIHKRISTTISNLEMVSTAALQNRPTNGPCTVLARCGVRHPAAAGIGHLGRGKTLENLVDVAVSWVGTPSKTNVTMEKSIINWMGPYQRTPKWGARVIRYSGLGVRSVGPVGDFLEKKQPWMKMDLLLKK